MMSPEFALFETGIIQDIFSWFFQSHLLASEVVREFNRIKDAQGDKPFVPLGNSGGAQPLLTALSDPANQGFGVKTAILVGAPVTTTDLGTSSLERIVNVYGSEDYFLKDGLLGSNPFGIHIQDKFTHQTHSFDTINIELPGIHHKEYFYDSNTTPTELQRKSNDFIAFLTKAALLQTDLETFLQKLVSDGQATFTETTTLDANTGIQHRVRTYVLDLEKWEG